MLGTAGAIGAGVALGGAAPAPGRAGRRQERAPAYDTAPARAALTRLLPGHADQFQLVALAPDGTGDRFRVEGRTGRITVAGTTSAVLLTGVHWYLKYTCRAHLTWAGDQVELPGRLPAPASPSSAPPRCRTASPSTTPTTATPPRTPTGRAGSG